MRHRAVLPFVALLAAAAAAPGEADAKPRSAVVVVQDSVATPGGDVVINGRVVADKGFEVTRPGAIAGRFATLKKIVKNLQLIRGQPVKRATVELDVDGKTYRVRTDRSGAFSLSLGAEPHLAAGRYTVNARLVGDLPFRVLPGRLSMRPDRAGRALVSDIDDTVLETGATNPLKTIWHALTTDAGDMKPFPGAARTYRDLAADEHAPIYVSAGPATLYPKLRGFLQDHGFPEGEIVLQRPSIRDLFTNLRRYKTRRVEEVARSLPGHELVLVGDSGQKDPEGYRDVHTDHPSQVAGIFIHRVTDESPGAKRFAGEQVFDHYDRALVRRIRAATRRTAGRQPAARPR